jgi:hypothetical protein
MAAEEMLCVPTILAGECLTQEWWWGESKKSNMPTKPHRMYKNSAKMAGFPHFLPKKSPTTQFFA